MSSVLPSVDVSVKTRSLGLQDAGQGESLAIVGPAPSSNIAAATPLLYGSATSLSADHVDGPLVEAGALALEITGRPVVLVRTETTTAGARGTIDDDGVTGTSVITATASTHPDDDYEVRIDVVTGGNVGTAGITYTWSLDGGRTVSPVTALGTATTLVVPGTAGGVSYDLATGTLVKGDFWTERTAAPKWSDAELDAAMLALQRSGYSWKKVLILGPMTNTNLAALKTRWAAMFAAYKYKRFHCHFRTPNEGETEASYLAAFKSACDTTQDFYGCTIWAGSEEVQSCATKPRIYRRSPAWQGAAYNVRLGPGVSLAEVADGAGAWQWGARIADENGNPKHHDEWLDPGLDAARAATLRSQPGYPGRVFVTRDRTLATLGTDFMWGFYWDAMIEVLDAAIPKLIGLIQKKMLPDRTTGRIAAEAANNIELLVKHEVDAKVTGKGVIVSFKCQIDRTVNVYSTPKLPVTITAVPFFYPDGFSVTAALENPSYSNA